MEQGCPHRSILPHIFPDCNSFAIKIGGKFCGVRGVCPGGGACPGVAGAAGVSGTRRGACPLCRLPTLPLWCPRGGVPALSPAYTAFSFVFLPPSPQPPSRREGGDQGYFMQGASPLASPGLNPRGTGSPCRCGKLNGGGLPRRCRLGGRQRYPAGGVPALSPAYTATVVPAGGLPALSPVNPAFSFAFAPIPPAPFPAGRG